MKNRLVLFVAILAFGSAGPLAADEEILATTTEFGITITPTQIYDAIQQSQDFWTPVRHHIASERFAEGEPAVRRQAADFIAKVNNRLADRLFSDDEAAAVDLIDYITTRLRLIAVYRQLRSTIGNDELVLSVKCHWDQELRDLCALAPDRQAARILDSNVEMNRLFAQAGLSEDKVARCVELWQTAAQVTLRLNQTAAGQMMVEFQREVEALDPPLATLIYDVVVTADWAEITRPDGTMLNRAHFERAWVEVKKQRSQRIARLPVKQS